MGDHPRPLYKGLQRRDYRGFFFLIHLIHCSARPSGAFGHRCCRCRFAPGTPPGLPGRTACRPVGRSGSWESARCRSTCAGCWDVRAISGMPSQQAPTLDGWPAGAFAAPRSIPPGRALLHSTFPTLQDKARPLSALHSQPPVRGGSTRKLGAGCPATESVTNGFPGPSWS